MNLTTRIARGKVIYVKPTDASKRAIIARRKAEVRQPWGSPHSTHSGIEADWCGNCRDEKKPEWVKRARESRLPVADFTNGSYVPRGSERGA